MARHVKVLMACKQCQAIKPCDGRFFCSRSCYQENRKQLRIEVWKNGGPIGVQPLRKYLREISDGRCSNCNLNEWMGSKLVCEVEHKDGNSENSSPNNVCLLCPNCHSQTDTYKAKNRGNGRHSRRKRYAEGKSY